jgi:hypothetical protein
MAVRRQEIHQIGGDIPVVFDDQEAHAYTGIKGKQTGARITQGVTPSSLSVIPASA